MNDDFRITWAYVVKRMKEKYGIDPDNTDLRSVGDIELRVDNIWVEFYNKKMGEEVTKCSE